MKTVFGHICLFIQIIFFSAGISADDRVVSMASLEWPPYIGRELPDQGALAIVARAAFAKAGYELRIDFYPWARTLHMARTEKKYAGYFPEYFSEEIAKEFVFSDPVGTSPLGFAERKDAPVSWQTLDDLCSVKIIGTVRAYVNTEAFDLKAARGEIRVEEVTDDATNLRKIAGGRIPLAVIDRYVMQYLLKTELQDKQGLLQFNARLLEDKKLFLCFRSDAEGERMRDIFNSGLRQIQAELIASEYFEKIFLH